MVVVVDSVVVDVVEMRQCTSPAQSDISEIIPTLLCPPCRSSLCTLYILCTNAVTTTVPPLTTEHTPDIHDGVC